MKLLAFDTSTDACSCAVYVDGDVFERYELAPRRHAHLLLNMIGEALAEGGLSLGSLDAIAFGRGPGSFTGVRIAAAAAQALAFGAGLPVVPVSSLAAMAQHVHVNDGAARIAAAFDARMNEVYWGVFEAGRDGLVRNESPERVCPPDAISSLEGSGWTGAGSGWLALDGYLRKRFDAEVRHVLADRFPTAGAASMLAADAFRRGNLLDPRDALPVYLRDRVTRD